MRRGLREREKRALKQQLELVPEDVRARILLATSHAFFGNWDDAVREVQTAVALQPNHPVILYNAACVYGQLQEKSQALELFKKARQAGYGNLDWAARDPDLACLHDDPEFQRLIAGGEPRD